MIHPCIAWCWALAAVHAARRSDIQALCVKDIEFGARSITINRHTYRNQHGRRRSSATTRRWS